MGPHQAHGETFYSLPRQYSTGGSSSSTTPTTPVLATPTTTPTKRKKQVFSSSDMYRFDAPLQQFSTAQQQQSRHRGSSSAHLDPAAFIPTPVPVYGRQRTLSQPQQVTKRPSTADTSSSSIATYPPQPPLRSPPYTHSAIPQRTPPYTPSALPPSNSPAVLKKSPPYRQKTFHQSTEDLHIRPRRSQESQETDLILPSPTNSSQGLFSPPLPHQHQTAAQHGRRPSTSAGVPPPTPMSTMYPGVKTRYEMEISNPTPGTSTGAAARRKTGVKRLVPLHTCMSLNRTDRLRLLKFPGETIAKIRDAIEHTWRRGLDAESPLAGGGVEFKLRGNPWAGQGDESVPACVMMCEVLSVIYHNGWKLVMATDISKRAMDKDTLIFRLSDLPSPCTFLSISFHEGDKLRITQPSAPLGNEVINAVKNAWGINVQSAKWKMEGISWEFKISGNPWYASGDESVHVRLLLLSMLDSLTALGWDMHASIDMVAGPGGMKNPGADTDCWIMRKPSS